MVTAVKRDREVGLAYMKSFEREQRIREQSREEGYTEGRQEGRQEGIREGLQEGIREGRQEGIREGRQEGIREGRIESIRNMLAAKIDVTILLEAGFTMDEIKMAENNEK